MRVQPDLVRKAAERADQTALVVGLACRGGEVGWM